MYSCPRLKPSEIRYSQDSIGGRFMDGRSLSTTLQQLLSNAVTPDTIPCIEVVIREDSYYALTGNRRLFLYKKLENAGLLDDIPVRIRPLSSVLFQFSQRFTTMNDGRSIRLRHGPVTAFEMDNMINRHGGKKRKYFIHTIVLWIVITNFILKMWKIFNAFFPGIFCVR